MSEAIPLRPDAEQATVIWDATGSYSAACAVLRREDWRARAFGDREPQDLWLSLMGQVPMLGEERISDAMLARFREGLELHFAVPSATGKPLPVKCSPADCGAAIAQVAHERAIHPVVAYLDGLKWDGHSRLGDLAEHVLNTTRDELTIALLRCFLIGAVKRARWPGVKMDTVLVLFGTQGAKKSTFLKALFGEDWFCDSEMVPGQKDAYQLVQTAWCFEWAELSAMHSARDQEAIKAFLSSSHDTFRPPYGRAPDRFPRSCVIAGTTNREEFLLDPTGARRFWPVEVGASIDVDALERMRDQLWAEADHLAARGEDHWLTPDEEHLLLERHMRHEQRDPWVEIVAEWLDDKAAVQQVTVPHLLVYALGMTKDKPTKRDEQRMGDVLKALKWKKSTRRDERHPRRSPLWERPQ